LSHSLLLQYNQQLKLLHQRQQQYQALLTDTVVGPWVDVLTSGEVVVSTGKVVVIGTVVVSGEVVSVVNNFSRSQHIYPRTNNSISQYHKSDCN
jgi:hypothetical protein